MAFSFSIAYFPPIVHTLQKAFEYRIFLKVILYRFRFLFLKSSEELFEEVIKLFRFTLIFFHF
jgi:hypothetical protein